MLKKTTILALLLSFTVSGLCFGVSGVSRTAAAKETAVSASLPAVEAYHGVPFVPVNENVPEFRQEELATTPFQSFSPLDGLGRTGAGIACLGSGMLPTETRTQIGDVRPAGWHTVRYDDLIEDRFLYNRCHVIAYQLGGDNATPENLFTGTRYLNVSSMLFFENLAASYIRTHADCHVMYRVTPVYSGDDLVASGVQMEAYSVEDQGQGLSFNVFLYNIQPGIEIDYSDGESRRAVGPGSLEVMSCAAAYAMLTGTAQAPENGSNPDRAMAVERSQAAGSISRSVVPGDEVTYILNTNTRKFHVPDCASVSDMKEKNRREFSGTREEAISQGYVPCKRCNP